MLIDWFAVVLIGLLVGAGELVARYRDAPFKVLFTLPSLFYLLLNAAAAVAALGSIRAFGWTFGLSDPPDAIEPRWAQVLVAGFGALAVFRSSFFTVRVADQEVGIGPSSFLQVVLGAVDRAVDRRRGRERAAAVRRIMSGVSFDRAHEALPTYCLALMQNLPNEDQEALGQKVSALQLASMEDHAKALALGLAIIDAMGEDVLASAVESLGEDIRV